MDFTHSQRFQAPRPRRLPLLIDPMPDSSGHISDSDAGAQRASPDTLQRSAASSGLRRAKGRQSPCPGGSSTNEAGCTGGRGNFREFMISQRAAQIYKDALHQMAHAPKVKAGKIKRRIGPQPSEAECSGEGTQAEAREVVAQEAQGWGGLSAEFVRRETETHERRMNIVRGARPTSAFAAQWQRGAVMTAVLDPNHPKYLDRDVRKEREAIVGRGRVSTRQSMEAFLQRLQEQEDVRRLRAEQTLHEQLLAARYSPQLSQPISFSRLQDFLKRNDPTETLERRIRSITDAERRIWVDVGFRPGGYSKALNQHSSEHSAFLARQAAAAERAALRHEEALRRARKDA